MHGPLGRSLFGFDDAATVFYDPLAVIFDDELHSEGEKREIVIGHDAQNRLLLVSFSERTQVVRIISARPATKQERKDCEEQANY
ncbi:MAG: BrnT family toxin [Methylococcales bacterium]